jgi:hypothetical protein
VVATGKRRVILQPVATPGVVFMLAGTLGGLICFVIALFFSPETKGKILVNELQIIPAE